MANSRQQDQQMQTRPATPVFTDQMAQQDIQQQCDQTMQAFSEQADALLKDKRTLFGFERKDSAEMTAVKNALTHINNLWQVKLAANKTAFAQQCDTMAQAYDALAQRCRTYVENRHPHTPHGKARFRMVHQLLTQVEREQQILASCAQEVYQQVLSGQQADWGTVLWQMRTAQLDTNGYATTTLGGGSSFVLRIQRGNERIYFKPEEKRLERSGDATLEVDIIEKTLMEHKHDTAMYDAFAKLHAMKGVEDIAELIKLGNNLVSMGFANSLEQLTQEQMQGLLSRKLAHTEFANPEQAIPLCRLAVILQRRKTLEDYCDFAKIDQQATISTRNVATTRMAKLFGIEDMVAQSRTVMLTHAGKTMRGNVMREATGRTIEDLQQEAREQHLEMEYSPNALRQLMILQLFDALCGQIDRNRSNFLFEYEDKGSRRVLTRLTAIDNDLAFGKLTFQDVRDKNIGQMPLLGDPQNKDRLLVPGVDAAFYHQLCALSPQMLEFALGDVLSRNEIRALCERLAGIKKMLQDNVANGNVTLLQSDDWADMMPAFARMRVEGMRYLTPKILSDQVERQAAAATAAATTTTATTTTGT